MGNLLIEYKKLLLLLQKDGRGISKDTKKVIVNKIIVLEKALIKILLKRMLTGAITLNITQFPPRIRIILQRVLNRRLHIIYMLEKIKKESLMDRDKKKDILSNVLLISESNAGTQLSSMTFNDISMQNKKSKKVNIQKIITKYAKTF
ncbi:MAG: hypothetical protein ACI9CD_000199 [Candidatus Deianiraeaceae bacterium]|jgi:hypothetical protein